MSDYKPMWYQDGAFHFADGDTVYPWTEISVELNESVHGESADGVWPLPNDYYVLRFEDHGQWYGLKITLNIDEIAAAGKGTQKAHIRLLKQQTLDALRWLQIQWDKNERNRRMFGQGIKA